MPRPRCTRLQSALGLGALAAFVLMAAAPRRAPAGTVAEQRARLPPPVQCEQSIEGIWKSHDYRADRREWTIFTLEVHRVDGTDALRGTIHNQTWYADADQSEPGPCIGELHRKISMDAVGFVRGEQIEFGGVGQWRLDEVICGDSELGYNLDVFTGPIDAELLEFQAVNNDGGVAVDEPTVFRRIGCLPALEADDPRVVVTPPAFYPPEESQAGGCGGR
ncbi:hypothetical protein [Paraliomyxa miuraensis]|uniref:hypothetical protein n=1 Tax=Paraliomyxa miuraensis TaxID=376150 RepID=UPI0022530D05|nr:hypothetical protein [Paraliomyxa miuraensis]MCX4245517.1 hypothetical protein [Paraliomyxa miuraensis]